MLKVNIGKDERYPDYYISVKPSEHDETIEISKELYDKICQADKAYSEAQALLANLYNKQK
jgi:hypothetical protein